MTKYIEVEVPDEFTDRHNMVSWASKIGEPQRVSRDELLTLVLSFHNDIQAAHGIMRAGRRRGDIDEEAMDWPDLADTYHKAHKLLTDPEEVDDVGLTAEQLENKYAPDGGDLDDCHPVHTVRMWETQVHHHATRRGYWDWVVAQIEEADHD